MKRFGLACFIGLMATSPLLASSAETSAGAGSGRGRNGTATATANYEGDIGFARADSNSGRNSSARGVAVGVDEDGVSVSVSQAIAPRNGPAIAVNFNLGIGEDGQVSSSTGLSIADGGSSRSASAGGFVTTERGGTAGSVASGQTHRGGTVTVQTTANDSGRREAFRRPIPTRTVHSSERPVIVRHGIERQERFEGERAPRRVVLARR